MGSYEHRLDWLSPRQTRQAGCTIRSTLKEVPPCEISDGSGCLCRRLCSLCLFALIPASSSAAVFISVGFAPPVLPVYVQPPCPEPGWMWTPGYWAYGDDGYYWVPGTWVPAPYVGALWTPGYWGWGGGLYVWHPGYWGPHVGYYGGVNYGFGYMGIGFVGGMWAGGAFRYNTAVMRVNTTVIHNTYVDNTIVRNNTVVNDRHVAYSGGPGGINHQPTPEENRYSHEQHVAPTSYQTQAGIRSQDQCEQLCQPQWRASGKCRDSEADDGRIAQQWRRRCRMVLMGLRVRPRPITAAVQAQTQAHTVRAAGMHPAPVSRPVPESHEARPAPQPHGSQPHGGGGGGGGDHDHGKGH